MKHWSERAALTCICGHVARSRAAEAIHRHNFPALCRKPKARKMNDKATDIPDIRPSVRGDSRDAVDVALDKIAGRFEDPDMTLVDWSKAHT